MKKRVSIQDNSSDISEEASIMNEFYQSNGGFQHLKSKKGHTRISKKEGNDITKSSSQQEIKKSQKELKSALKKPQTPGLGIGGVIHLPPLHVEDVNNVSDIIHRVTLQSGLIPGSNNGTNSKDNQQIDPSGRVIQTPINSLDKAAHMGELQFKNMMESSTIKEILNEIITVHNEIQSIVHQLGHRPSLASQLTEANKLNIKLFQRIISEILMLHRHKFQSQTTKCHELEGLVTSLQERSFYLQEELVISKQRIDKLDNKCQEYEVLCKAKDTEILLLSDQLHELERYQAESLQQLEEEKRLHEREQEEIKSRYNKLLNEERNILNNQRHEMMLQLMRENELYHQSMLLQDQRMSKNKKPAEAVEPSKPRVMMITVGTQTEVDDFGLWHKQDGWIFPISGTIIARNQWKRAGRFASCPSCKGVGRYLIKAATQFHKFQRGELENDAQMKSFRTSGKWVLPDELVQFMSNLPKSIEGSKVWPLSRCIRFWWSLICSKLEADAEDDRYGYGIQNISQFLIETFLLRSENRHQAEILMYHFMRSIREHVLVKKHPFLHTLARFLGALDGPFMNENAIEEDVESSLKRNSNQKNGLVNQKGLIRVTSTSLPTSILTVYLFARNCMLLPYRGEYLEAIATAKSNSKMMEKNLHLFHGNGNGPASDNASQDTAADTEPVEEDRDEFSSPIWAITIPDHVCILEKLQMWIPLDRAVFVTRAVLSFLSEKHMAILLKHIESMAMFMSSQGVLEEVDGNHTIIRAAMRRFQDMATEGVNNKPTTHLSSLDTKIIVVNLDKLLQAIVELLLGRVKSLEDRLKKQFIEGDGNRDGVLSFNEFLEIMRKLAPEFPQRRILRMFREALMRGKDDGHIDQQSFVEVCKQHGLAQLVDINRLKKTALAELYPGEELGPNTTFDSSSERRRGLLTLAEVSIAAKAFRRVIGRQQSQSKSQTVNEESDPTVIRRNLSEELQPSSKEIAEKIISALVAPNIRKISSEEDLLALRQSAQIANELQGSVPIQKKKSPRKLKEKNSSVPRIPLSERLSRYTESNPPSSTSRNALNTNTTRTTTSCKSSSITDEEEEDEDGKVISLSSIRKSASQTPRITPQLSPKKTPRITPRFHPPKHSTYRGPHLLNSADILSLSENDTTDSMDASQPPPSDPSTIYLPNLIDDSINASSDILFGNEEPSLFDI